MPPAVTSQDVAAYQAMVEGLARRYNRPGIEYDDLVQEGLINVWQTLLRGAQPSPEYIAKRMKRWGRKMRKQRLV